MRARAALAGCLVSVALAAGCTSASPFGLSPAVTGTAYPVPDTAYQQGCRLDLKVVDTATGSSASIGHAEVHIGRAWRRADVVHGVEFSVPYDPSLVDPDRTYVLEARLVDPDANVLAEMEPEPVLTKGNPATQVRIIVCPPPPATTPTPSP